MDDAGTTASAVAAARAVSRRAGLRVDDPVVLSDGANVVVHLRPAPVVAKVAAVTHLIREPRAWLERELAIAAHLAVTGVPATTVSDLLPAVVHAYDGRLMSFWSYLPDDGRRDVPPAVLGAMLRELHSAMRSCPVPLPRLATQLEDITRFLARAQRSGTAGWTRLAEAFARVVRELPDGPDQQLHGDPHPLNLLHSPSGWTWLDLEDACSGPVAWDLACVDGSRQLDGAAALRAYGEVPDLGPWRELRRLHATVWLCLYAERQPAHRRRAAELLASWG